MLDELRIVVIADDPLMRAGLTALLSGHAGCQVIGQISRDDDRSKIRLANPDVALWDLGWEAELSLEALDDLRQEPFPLVALAVDEDAVAVLLQAGVAGVLLRHAKAVQIVAALAAATRGLTVIDPILVEALLPAGGQTPATLMEPLTPREEEVLQLLAEGLANKAIGRRLQVSEHTVKFHVNAILSKLGAQSRTEAVVRATRMGLILL